MEEYEYSFKVESIEPYINYCEDNGYLKIKESIQNRIVYENGSNEHLIARITSTIVIDENEEYLDFKNFSEKHKELQVSDESIPFKVDDNNRAIIMSMLEVLDFEESADNTRKRVVYENNGVIFEIDEYITPKMNVVAIEGNKEKVDLIYQEISKKINNEIK